MHAPMVRHGSSANHGRSVQCDNLGRFVVLKCSEGMDGNHSASAPEHVPWGAFGMDPSTRPDEALDENTPSASLFRMIRLLRLTRRLDVCSQLSLIFIELPRLRQILEL